MLKRGNAGLIFVVLSIVITMSIAVIFDNFSGKIVKSGLDQAGSKIEFVESIDLSIVEAYFSENNLFISVQNKGQKDISSLIVRITSKDNLIYLNKSVYFENRASLEPLSIKEVIIPAPFGNTKENYSLIEIIPKFEVNNKETIAETAKASLQGINIGKEK